MEEQQKRPAEWVEIKVRDAESNTSILSSQRIIDLSDRERAWQAMLPLLSRGETIIIKAISLSNR